MIIAASNAHSCYAFHFDQLVWFLTSRAVRGVNIYLMARISKKNNLVSKIEHFIYFWDNLNLMARTPGSKSAAQLSREYIDSHPSIKDAIKLGLINYSALTRRIMQDLGISNEEAVLVASRRYGENLKWTVNEAGIKQVLGSSSLEVKNKITIITARNDWEVILSLDSIVKKILDESSIMQVLQGTTSITVIVEDAMKGTLEAAIGKRHIIKSASGLVQVTVKSPAEITGTHGVLAFLSSSLASKGINTVEVMSCYTDTIFIVEEADMMSAFDTLSSIMR